MVSLKWIFWKKKSDSGSNSRRGRTKKINLKRFSSALSSENRGLYRRGINKDIQHLLRSFLRAMQRYHKYGLYCGKVDPYHHVSETKQCDKDRVRVLKLGQQLKIDGEPIINFFTKYSSGKYVLTEDKDGLRSAKFKKYMDDNNIMYDKIREIIEPAKLIEERRKKIDEIKSANTSNRQSQKSFERKLSRGDPDAVKIFEDKNSYTNNPLFDRYSSDDEQDQEQEPKSKPKPWYRRLTRKRSSGGCKRSSVGTQRR